MDTIAVALALGAEKKANKAGEQAKASSSAIVGPATVSIAGAGDFQMFHANSEALSETSLMFTVVLTEGRDTADDAKTSLTDLWEKIQKKIAEAGEAILVVDASVIPVVLPYGLGFTMKSLTTMNTFSEYSAYAGLLSTRLVLDATSLGLGVIDKEVLSKLYLTENGGDVVVSNALGDGLYHCILPLIFRLT